MLASPLAALAQSPDPTGTQTLSSFDDRWYLLPFGTYTWADENRGTDDGCGWGFAVGKPVNEWLNLELRGTYTSLPSDGEYSLPNLNRAPAGRPAGLPKATLRSATSPLTGCSSSTGAERYNPSCSRAWEGSTTTSTATAYQETAPTVTRTPPGASWPRQAPASCSASPSMPPCASTDGTATTTTPAVSGRTTASATGSPPLAS